MTSMEALGGFILTGIFIYGIFYIIRYAADAIGKHNANQLAAKGGILISFNKLAQILVDKGYDHSGDSFTKVQFTKNYYPHGRTFFLLEKTSMADRPYSINYHTERKVFGNSFANSQTYYIEPHFTKENFVAIVETLEKSLLPISALESISLTKPSEEVTRIYYDKLIKDAGINIIDSYTVSGEFGYVETNPIPTKTILGSEEYLRKLRTSNGKSITYSRNGTTMTRGIHTPIDKYIIYESNKEIALLYLCPYSKETSTIAPKGFKLVF